MPQDAPQGAGVAPIAGHRSPSRSPVRRRLAVLVLGALVSGCATARRGALDPQGPHARRVADFFDATLLIATAVVVIVVGLTLFAMFRRRREDVDDAVEIVDSDSRLSDTTFVAIGGLAIPTVVLLGLMVMTFVTLADEPTEGDREITVIGHQFWWEVRYPDEDVVTANEIHIPTGTDVQVRLETDDVLHSFWVPELGGKADLVPGRTNSLVLHADEPGRWQGQCAEYCGLQHAHMAFLVIAQEPEDFRRWLAGQARPAVVDDSRGEELFERHACAGCHTIRGTPASGRLGPDLTHLASRETLAAATIPNTRGHLAGWIVNSQTVKPGNRMPPITSLEPDELHELVAYLERLE